MASKSAHDAHGEHEERDLEFGENIRGMAIVAAGAAGLIGLAWVVMMMLTAPDGWVTKAANSAISGQSAQLVSFGAEPAQ